MKTKCSYCGKRVDTTKFGKYAPHFVEGKTRCDGSNKRVSETKEVKHK